MSTKVGFGKITDFTDISANPVEWAESLREDAGETEVAALRLADGEIYALRKQDERFRDWSAFLEDWRQFEQPVYVEADEDSRVINTILAPIARRIEHISSQPENGRLKVNVFTSPSVHYLNAAHPNFEELRKLLEDAEKSGGEVLVTTDPNNAEILDVRVPEGSNVFELGDMPNGVVTEAEANILFRDLTEHLLNQSRLNDDDALREFQNLAAQSQIPFDYPRDCCTARAHEMCRILRQRGIQGRKIWNYGQGWTSNPKRGTLRVETPNVPEGFVEWTYHVAPVISVIRVSGAIRNMVLDPAIFNRPALTATWREAQQDDLSFWTITEDNYFYRDYFDFSNAHVILDPNFVQTRYLLTAHRASRASMR